MVNNSMREALFWYKMTQCWAMLLTFQCSELKDFILYLYVIKLHL